MALAKRAVIVRELCKLTKGTQARTRGHGVLQVPWLVFLTFNVFLSQIRNTSMLFTKTSPISITINCSDSKEAGHWL